MEITDLPHWAQVAIPALTALTVGIGGGITILRSRSRGDDDSKAGLPAPQPEHFDPDELLSAAAVVRFFADVSEIASNAKIQSEALRNLSAVATIVGKRLEDGYEELRVFKAVRQALDEERRQRGGPPTGGWGQ